VSPGFQFTQPGLEAFTLGTRVTATHFGLDRANLFLHLRAFGLAARMRGSGLRNGNEEDQQESGMTHGTMESHDRPDRETSIQGKSGKIRKSQGFPPIAGRDARVLILGSLPSERSIREGEYYAHPQNAFWRIMRELVGAEGPYEDRCATLKAARIAVWDVLHQSVRPGSMDADIQLDTSEVNDFEGFLASHKHVEMICFNGRKAEQMFMRFVKLNQPPRLVSLPSTSPAYASMPFTEKLAAWREGIIDCREDK
jgi:hypoxanthine-DNA glycosylase